MLLAYFPVKSSLKQPLSKLVLWLAPLLALLCAAGGVMCYARRMPTAPVLVGLTLLAVVIYIKTLRISLWKSGTIALSVCAVFACINSLCRAINAAMLIDSPQAQAAQMCIRDRPRPSRFQSYQCREKHRDHSLGRGPAHRREGSVLSLIHICPRHCAASCGCRAQWSCSVRVFSFSALFSTCRCFVGHCRAFAGHG